MWTYRLRPDGTSSPSGGLPPTQLRFAGPHGVATLDDRCPELSGDPSGPGGGIACDACGAVAVGDRLHLALGPHRSARPDQHPGGHPPDPIRHHPAFRSRRPGTGCPGPERHDLDQAVLRWRCGRGRDAEPTVSVMASAEPIRSSTLASSLLGPRNGVLGPAEHRSGVFRQLHCEFLQSPAHCDATTAPRLPPPRRWR